jgi:hypothetical protein
MHTQNVNVKTAGRIFPEDGGNCVCRKCSGGSITDTSVQRSATRCDCDDVGCQSSRRRTGRIRRFEAVIWHGWSFQPDFLKEQENVRGSRNAETCRIPGTSLKRGNQ